MRGAQVALAGPAEGVVVALARALAAAVEQEHAVAVADEHPRVRHRLRAARERDDGGAVARRDVPGAQPQSVARDQLDLLGKAGRGATAATGERALCVATIAIAGGEHDQHGEREHRDAANGARRPSRRPSEPVVRRVRQSVATPSATQDGAGDTRRAPRSRRRR